MAVEGCSGSRRRVPRPGREGRMGGADEWEEDAGVYRSRGGMNSAEGASSSSKTKGSEGDVTTV